MKRQSKSQHPLSYRTYYPRQSGKDEISEPVLADTVREAMDKLGTSSMNNLQVMQDGRWVWVI